MNGVYFTEVLKSEREAGRALYDQENKAVEDRLAFGLRSEGPPSLYYPATGPLPTTQPGNSVLSYICH